MIRHQERDPRRPDSDLRRDSILQGQRRNEMRPLGAIGGGHDGAAHFKQLSSHHADVLRLIQARSREDINSILEMVRGSWRTIRDAREAIERADAVVARRLSEGSRAPPNPRVPHSPGRPPPIAEELRIPPRPGFGARDQFCRPPLALDVGHVADVFAAREEKVEGDEDRWT
jgi:hypothetical protein